LSIFIAQKGCAHALNVERLWIRIQDFYPKTN
jgi:hypothetical protein